LCVSTEMEMPLNEKSLVTILSISPATQDHASLEAIISQSNASLLVAHDFETALALLENHDISVVVTECELIWVWLLWNDGPLVSA